ncbi:MAG: hypothetical protein KDA61_18865 [Planctomycetales bacterium]|nr:hypothetical protein [Planctomycetales bacterium]
MNSYCAISDRVKSLRKSAQVTQKRLAAQAGYCIRTIRNLEAGRPVTAPTLVDVAEALHAELCEIVSPEQFQAIVQPNRTAVESLFRALAKHARLHIEDRLTEDFRYWRPGDACIPEGKSPLQLSVSAAIEDFRRQFFDHAQPVVEGWIVTHDHVVVQGISVSQEAAQRTVAPSAWCLCIRLRGDRIAEIRHYEDCCAKSVPSRLARRCSTERVAAPPVRKRC